MSTNQTAATTAWLRPSSRRRSSTPSTASSGGSSASSCPARESQSVQIYSVIYDRPKSGSCQRPRLTIDSTRTRQVCHAGGPLVANGGACKRDLRKGEPPASRLHHPRTFSWLIILFFYSHRLSSLNLTQLSSPPTTKPRSASIAQGSTCGASPALASISGTTRTPPSSCASGRSSPGTSACPGGRRPTASRGRRRRSRRQPRLLRWARHAHSSEAAPATTAASCAAVAAAPSPAAPLGPNCSGGVATHGLRRRHRRRRRRTTTTTTITTTTSHDPLALVSPRLCPSGTTGPGHQRRSRSHTRPRSPTWPRDPRCSRRTGMPWSDMARSHHQAETGPWRRGRGLGWRNGVWREWKTICGTYCQSRSSPPERLWGG